MTPPQRQIADAIERSSGGSPFAPYAPLIYSPETGQLVLDLTEFLQFCLRVPEPLRLLAVLVTGRHKNVDFDASKIADEAREAGLSDAKVGALIDGRPPADLTPEETMVYDYCIELHQTGRIKDETFDRVLTRFGREICLELLMVCGGTALSAMMANVTRPCSD